MRQNSLTRSVLASVFVMLAVVAVLPGGSSAYRVTTLMARASMLDRAAGRTVRIEVVPRVINPAGTIRFRLQNRTKRIVKFGAPFEIEVYSGGEWTPAPFNPPGPWPAELGQLRPGKSGPWEKIEVPPEAISGRYRIVKAVKIKGHRCRVTAAFKVRA
jgi:Bacterial Ig-like domain